MKQDKLPNGFIEVTILKIGKYGDKIRFKSLINVYHIAEVNLNNYSGCTICMQGGISLTVEEEYDKIIDYIKESQLR